ncbi:hypothetical protein CF394_02595 [Tetzosporium hominis]|uniref:Serine aminopeptidase S33 domain-containing protein n=1 Tax=Tetzosporium hominis TaxID=2020506 RepID=A0A264W8H1_9BACL|nr:alpha/beta hydrolase [Tetzosporium hominis]OZS79327.1 hypothetical protein CF394_02595 [Tetzosporium hominis]
METKWLEMTDGTSLFARVYPKPDAQVIVFILHGLAEHGGRYDDFAQFLGDKGYEVVVPDHRGHGETGMQAGKLGYFADELGFERVVDDCNELIHLHTGDRSDKKVILLGHSMGSFLARRYVQKYPQVVDQLILVGTGGDPGFMGKIGSRIASWKSRGGGATEQGDLLNKLTFGSYNKRITSPSTKFDWLSTDTETVRAYEEDPFCGFVPTNQLYVDLLDGLQTIHSKKELERVRKDLPILLIAGTDDPVGNYGKGVRLLARDYQKIGMEDVTLVLIEQERHEILNGHNRHKVYDHIANWIVKK